MAARPSLGVLHQTHTLSLLFGDLLERWSSRAVRDGRYESRATMCFRGCKDGTAFHSTRNNRVKESMVPLSDAEVLIDLRNAFSAHDHRRHSPCIPKSLNMHSSKRTLERSHRTVTASCFRIVLSWGVTGDTCGAGLSDPKTRFIR